MNPVVSYSHNASWGAGGQGEALRQMGFALDLMPGTEIFSRWGEARKALNRNLSFSGAPEYPLFQLICGTPGLRSRRDWLTLLSDLEFDRRVAAMLDPPRIFHGVAGQCDTTFRKLQGTRTVCALTSLNTHIDYLMETLDQEHQSARGSGRHFVHPSMRRRVLWEVERADAIRVPSHWVKQTFVERGVPAGKIRVILHAVDHSQFHPVQKEDDIFRVMMVGSLDLRKGFHYLLQAFEEARIPRSELVLIGGTGDRWSKSFLNGFLKRNPNAHPFSTEVPAVPVEQTYGRASVLVHPSLEDGLAFVLLEALASGRPVIATRESGAADIVRDGENGFLVERRSVQELRDRLLLLAHDQALLQQMSLRAAASIVHLDYTHLAREIQAWYVQMHS